MKEAVIIFYLFPQAIQNPSNEALQDQAWAAVVPLVGKLKNFYEFSQRLGTVSCFLTVTSSQSIHNQAFLFMTLLSIYSTLDIKFREQPIIS